MKEKVYHVFRKNVEGAYLLDNKKNDLIYTDTIEKDAWEVFNDRVKNKKDKETYVLFSVVPGERYLQILCER